MKKYYRLVRRYYNYWFGKNAMSIWALPIIVPIGLLLILASGLEAVLCVVGAVIVLPIDGILRAFSWVIEKVFLRGEK